MNHPTTRRFVCFLLAALMAFSLCGCSASAPKITTQEEFESAMAQQLDLTLYTYDAEYAAYDLNDASGSSEVLDFTVEFQSADPISLPLVFADLEAAGWTVAEKSIHPFYDTYVNSKGEAVVLGLTSMPLMMDILGNYLIIETHTEKMQQDFSYRLERADNVPQFIIAGEITNKSTMTDVISTLGNPWKMTFDSEYGVAGVPAVEFFYGVRVDQVYRGGLTLTFSGETGEILQVYYCYLQAG